MIYRGRERTCMSYKGVVWSVVREWIDVMY